jgi:hypothetical protein
MLSAKPTCMLPLGWSAMAVDYVNFGYDARLALVTMCERVKIGCRNLPVKNRVPHDQGKTQDPVDYRPYSYDARPVNQMWTNEITQQIAGGIEMRAFVGGIAVAAAVLLMAATAGAVVTASSDAVRPAVESLELRSKTAVGEPTVCKSRRSRPHCSRLRANSYHQRLGKAPLAPSPAHVRPHHLPDYYVLHGPWL